MMANHPIKFSMVSLFFRDNNTQLQRGENSYSSGHVVGKSVIFDCSVQPALLKGEVKASMQNKSYKVEISIDIEEGIVGATCKYPRGQTICHHMAALCIFAHHNFSSTDGVCTWNVPNAVDPEVVQSLKDIYPPYNVNYEACSRIASVEEILKFKAEIKDHPVGFAWLLKDEPTPEHFILVDIEEILFSGEFVNSTNKKRLLLDKCAITNTVRHEVAKLTIKQADNEKWLIAKKNRLTASNFGAVLSACYKQKNISNYKIPQSLLRRLTNSYDLSSVKAIQWGRANEKYACAEFSLGLGLKVESTGLWLDNCGFLGASPDGLIGEDSIIEIKCPFRFRESGLLQSLYLDKSYIIFKTSDNVTVLNKTHEYWHQIQGQLLITNRKICWLVVWSPQHTEVVEIVRDPKWEKNIDILKQFYFNTYLKHICGATIIY